MSETQTLVQVTKEVMATLPPEVQEEFRLLRGLADLSAERWGYYAGRRLKQAEMSKDSKVERDAVSEIRKEITGEALEKLIADSDIESYKGTLQRLKDAREVLSKKQKPFRTKFLNPLSRATKYMDNEVIPDALRELGRPIQPRFNLSKWVNNALKEAENAKKDK